VPGYPVSTRRNVPADLGGGHFFSRSVCWWYIALGDFLNWFNNRFDFQDWHNQVGPYLEFLSKALKSGQFPMIAQSPYMIPPISCPAEPSLFTANPPAIFFKPGDLFL